MVYEANRIIITLVPFRRSRVRHHASALEFFDARPFLIKFRNGGRRLGREGVSGLQVRHLDR